MRIYCNVIDRALPEAGPRILTFGKTIWKALKQIMEDDGDYTNPTDTGFDIIINREGTGKNDTEYSVKSHRESTPLHPDPAIAHDWITNQRDLDAYTVLLEPEDLLKQLRGEKGGGRGRGDDDDGAREERPRGRGRPGDDARPVNRAPSRRNAQDDIEQEAADQDDGPVIDVKADHHAPSPGVRRYDARPPPAAAPAARPVARPTGVTNRAPVAAPRRVVVAAPRQPVPPPLSDDDIPF